MNIGDRIKKARKSKGITQVQLARVLDTRQSTISSWEKGEASPRRGTLKALSTLLEVSLVYLEFGENLDNETTDDGQQVIQVLGYVGAGGEVCPIDDHAMGGGLDEVECPPNTPIGTVAVIVRGDSMYPLLNDGSIIYFSKRDKDIESHYHRLIIAHFLDGRKAVKGLTPGSKRGCFTLTSTNKAPMVDMKLESVSPIDWIKPH